MSDVNLMNTSALQCVTKNDVDSLRIICYLADEGKFDLEEKDEYGNTALLKGCHLGRYGAVESLLEGGANVKAINYFGQNALTLATFGGHFYIVRKLLHYCSYVDFNAASITPALCIATLCEHKRLIKYFKSLAKNAEDNEYENTVHGLSPKDIRQMLRSTKPKEKHYKHIYV